MVALAIAATGCSSKFPPGTPAEERYHALDADVRAHAEGGWWESRRARDPEAIRDQLSQLRIDFPFSRWAVEAELLTADAFFVQERYEEALASYKAFAKSHPTHPQVGRALLRQAQCYFELAPRTTMAWLLGDELAVDLDQAHELSVYVLSQEVMDQFPGTEWAEQARQLRAAMGEVLAQHEIYVGDYYLRFEHFGAAAGRFRTVRERYPESRRYGEASYKLGRALGGLGLPAQARIAYEGVLSLPADRFPELPEIGLFERAWAYLANPELLAHNSGESFWKSRAQKALSRQSDRAPSKTPPSGETSAP